MNMEHIEWSASGKLREGGGGGHQRHRNLANLVLISGPQTAFLHHFFVFCRTNSFLPNRTLCLLDGMRWGWNLKLACLRTLLQGFYQTFCWFWLEFWLFLLLHLTYFQSHTDFGVWHNKLSELRPSFVSPIQFMLIFPQLIQNISDSAYIIYVQYWFVYFLCILLVWYKFVCFRCTALVQCTNSFTFCSSIYYQKVFVFVASKKRDHFVYILLHKFLNQDIICQYKYKYSKREIISCIFFFKNFKITSSFTDNRKQKKLLKSVKSSFL